MGMLESRAVGLPSKASLIFLPGKGIQRSLKPLCSTEPQCCYCGYTNSLLQDGLLQNWTWPRLLSGKGLPAALSVCLKLPGKIGVFSPSGKSSEWLFPDYLPFLPAPPAGPCSSPSPKVRVAELVVERMQQFKRVAPEQLKLSADGSVPKAAASGDFPARSQEQNPPEDGTCLPLALVCAGWVAGENGCLRSSPGSRGFIPDWLTGLVYKSLQIPEKTSLKDYPYFFSSSSLRLD